MVKYLLLTFSMLLFLSSVYFYKQEKEIIKGNKEVECIVKRINCNYGKRGGSTIWVDYKNKNYSVAVSDKICGKINVRQNILLFYNNKFDYLFMEDHLSIRVVLIFLVFLILVIYLVLYSIIIPIKT